MKKTELLEVLNKISTVYGADKFSLSPELGDVWYEVIGDYDFEPIMEATKRYMRKSEFPPTIAGIMKEYEAIQEEHNQVIRRLNEIRNDVFATWPLAHDHEDEDRSIYEEIVNDDLSRAEKLDRMVKERTYKMDHLEEDYIPIGEFLRSIENSELLS